MSHVYLVLHLLNDLIITAHKRSLGQGNIFIVFDTSGVFVVLIFPN